jgi:hypothetical protein
LESNQTEPQIRKKRNFTVSFLGWFGIIFSGYNILSGLVYFFIILFSGNLIKRSLSDFPINIGLILNLTVIFKTLLFSLAFVASLGVIIRKNWGRVIVIYFLSVYTAINTLIIMAITIGWKYFLNFMASKVVRIGGIDEISGTASSINLPIPSWMIILTFSLLAIINIAINGWVIQYLCREEIKEEFV